MNNIQLLSLIKTCPLTSSRFQGVYAIDTLPDTPIKNSTYICNLDKSDNAGTHWISIYVPKNGPVEYFDSYGLIAPRSLEDTFLNPFYLFNERSLQQPLSTVCGQYALYFIWQRLLRDSMDDVLHIFDECYQYYNDLLVNCIVEEHFDVDLDMFDVSSWTTNHS